MYGYIYIYRDTYRNMHECKRIYIYRYTYIYMCIYVYAHIYMYTPMLVDKL